MKYAALFIYLSFQNLYAEDFQMRLSADESKKVEIKNLDSIKVSSACFKQAIDCNLLMNNRVKHPGKIPASSDGQIGNPASKFCTIAGGTSIILEDKKHNEFDFCKLTEKYFVDSWDFYQRYKK